MKIAIAILVIGCILSLLGLPLGSAFLLTGIATVGVIGGGHLVLNRLEGKNHKRLGR